MSAKLLKGRPVADAITEKIKAKVQNLRQQGICPRLAIVRVGADESDIAYERSAAKRAEKSGIKIKNVVLPETISQEALITEIEKLNSDDEVNGILLFRPLPSHIDDAVAGQTIMPAKDIDGITNLSLAGVFTGTDTGFPPCTARACMEILDYYNIPLKGRKAVVVGRSLVVGRPLAMMLMKQNATVTICHTGTAPSDMEQICREADILAVASGRPGTIKKQHTNSMQTVIDVGINVDKNGNMCGDADFEEISEEVCAITPVPGGVGGVTSGILMLHTAEAAEKQFRDRTDG